MTSPCSFLGLFRTTTISVLSLAILAGCGLIPQRVSYDDPEVQELLRARDAAAVTRLGFTPVPPNAEIRLERRPRAGYDRMLHVHGATQRTIAYHKAESGYVWIGEQETFEGPKKYTDVDGTHSEGITLTYELYPLSQGHTNTLVINYMGEVPQENLTLEVVLPILREWGYDLGYIGSR